MCGIAGLIDCDHPIDASIGKRMADLVSYRGPDDEGFAWWGQLLNAHALPADKTVGFPHSNENVSNGAAARGGVFLATSPPFDYRPQSRRTPTNGFDGWQILDRVQWRSITTGSYVPNWSAKGIGSGRICDTEVILAAYACWGAECLHRFNGMWGLSIYDSQKQVLFAARDRFGVKPFYYAVDGIVSDLLLRSNN